MWHPNVPIPYPLQSIRDGDVEASARVAEDRRELRAVEPPVRAHAAADVEAEGRDRVDRLAHVVGPEPARQEERHPDLLADCAADFPVVAAPGATELLHGERGVARVEQD